MKRKLHVLVISMIVAIVMVAAIPVAAAARQGKDTSPNPTTLVSRERPAESPAEARVSDRYRSGAPSDQDFSRALAQKLSGQPGRQTRLGDNSGTSMENAKDIELFNDSTGAGFQTIYGPALTEDVVRKWFYIEDVSSSPVNTLTLESDAPNMLWNAAIFLVDQVTGAEYSIDTTAEPFCTSGLDATYIVKLRDLPNPTSNPLSCWILVQGDRLGNGVSGVSERAWMYFGDERTVTFTGATVYGPSVYLSGNGNSSTVSFNFWQYTSDERVQDNAYITRVSVGLAGGRPSNWVSIRPYVRPASDSSYQMQNAVNAGSITYGSQLARTGGKAVMQPWYIYFGQDQSGLAGTFYIDVLIDGYFVVGG